MKNYIRNFTSIIVIPVQFIIDNIYRILSSSRAFSAFTMIPIEKKKKAVELDRYMENVRRQSRFTKIE